VATQVKGVVNITQYDEDELKVSVRRREGWWCATVGGRLLQEVLGAAGAHAPCGEWQGSAGPSTGCCKAAPLTFFLLVCRRLRHPNSLMSQ
jgi:hypothetical protein